MKKLVFGLVLCMSMAIVAQAVPITVENYSFEDPCTVKLSNWTDVPNWSSDTVASDSGVESGGSPGNGDWEGYLMAGGDPSVWQLTGYEIAAGEVITLKMDARVGWMDNPNDKDPCAAATCRMTLYYDNGSRTVAKEQDVDIVTTYRHYSGLCSDWAEYTLEFDVDVDCSAAAGYNIGIELLGVSHEGDAGCWMDIDNIRLEQVLVSNPDPCDGHPTVELDASLSWTLEGSATSCDVYFGDDPNVIANDKVVDNQGDESYDPLVDLEPDTTYYWRVDAYVGVTCYEGERWDFTTIVTDPVVDEDPCGLTVNADETAVFRVKASNATGYSWQMLGYGEVGDESTLTIDNVQKVNEGTYWCEVSNAAETVETARVNLMTRRLVALYEFDDESLDAKDDEGATCWTGDYVDPNVYNPVPTVVYAADDPCTTGSGKSLQLAADELHVQIADSKDFFNFYPQGYTINAWVKTEQSGDWGAMVAKQFRGDEYTTYRGVVLGRTDGNKACSSLRQVFGGDITGDSIINDNQWHMITGTYDAETGTGSVYVDGLLENQIVDTANKAGTNDQLVVLGAETVSGISSYAGLLDKTSIYSYALSNIDVAVLYTDMVGGTLCVGGNPENDLNGDCRVDILDFAEFAADWMECNIVPTCLP